MYYTRTPTIKYSHGFTLIELMVSLALFSMVMLICIGTLLSIVDANRKAQSIRNVVDNVQSALESMARNIRTGYDFSCGGPANCTLFTYVDDQNNDVTYAYDPSGKKITRSINGGTAVSLTAPEAVIDEARFYVTGTDPGNEYQPVVTLVIRAHAGGSDTLTDFTVQTSIVQRAFDI